MTTREADIAMTERVLARWRYNAIKAATTAEVDLAIEAGEVDALDREATVERLTERALAHYVTPPDQRGVLIEPEGLVQR